MNISLLTVFSLLNIRYPEYNLKFEGLQKMKGLKLYSEKSSCDDGSLYVGSDSGNIDLYLSGKHIYSIETNQKLPEVFNNIQDVLTELRDWDMALHISILKKTGIQDLFDISEKLFGNPIILMDSDNRVVAFTSGNKLDIDLYAGMDMSSFLPDEIKASLKKRITKKRLAEYEYALIEAGENVKYPAIVSAIDIVSDEDDVRTYLLSMTFSQIPYNKGLISLFAFFAQQVGLYYELAE